MLASEDSSVELKPIPECDTTIDLTYIEFALIYILY